MMHGPYIRLAAYNVTYQNNFEDFCNCTCCFLLIVIAAVMVTALSGFFTLREDITGRQYHWTVISLEGNITGR